MGVQDERGSVTVKNRGRFKGAIRIPLRSLLLFFNNLALPRIPRKSLKFLVLLFSIPTAPTNHLSDWSGLSKNARGQKGANNPDDPVRVLFSAARVTTGFPECGCLNGHLYFLPRAS